eukprot:737525_1
MKLMVFHIFWLISLPWVHSANIWSDDMAVKSPDWSVDLGTYDIWTTGCPKYVKCYAFVNSDPVTLSRTAQTTGYSNVQLRYSYSSSGVKGQKECGIDYSFDGVNYVNIATIDTDIPQNTVVDQTYFGWGSNADNLSGYGVTIRIRSTGGCRCWFDDFSLTGTTARPTAAPTKTPSAYPTLPPSIPTTTPSKQPTLTPTTQPSKQPTIPSLSPTPDPYEASIWNDAFNGYSGWSHPPGTNTFYGNALLYSGRCPNTNSCVMFWTEGYYLWKSVSSVYTYSRLRFQLDIGTEGSVSCSASYKFDSGNWIEGIRVTNSGSEETDYQNFYAQTMYIEGDGTESTLTIKIASHHNSRSCYFDNAILKGVIRTAPPTLPSAAPSFQPSTNPTPHPWPVPIWEDTFTDSWDSWSLDYVVESCTWSTEITSEQAHCPNPGDEPCGEVVTHCYGQPVWIKKTADVSLLALLRLEFGVGAETYQTEAKCEVWYKFDTSSAWVMTNTTYGDHTKRTYYKPVVMYPHEMVFLDVPNGANTVTFKLQSNTRQSHPTGYSSKTSCYWDNVILRGKLRTMAPTVDTLSPTKHPSISPTSETLSPTKYPSTSPTNHPTNNPTKHPTKSPTTIPTLPTNHPTQKPSDQPTLSPSDGPTRDPTAPTTSAPSNHPTSQPSPRVTTLPPTSLSKMPTLSPTYIPSGNPSSNPSNKETYESSMSINVDSATEQKSNDVLLFSLGGVFAMVALLSCCFWTIYYFKRKNRARADTDCVNNGAAGVDDIAMDNNVMEIDGGDDDDEMTYSDEGPKEREPGDGVIIADDDEKEDVEKMYEVDIDEGRKTATEGNTTTGGKTQGTTRISPIGKTQRTADIGDIRDDV